MEVKKIAEFSAEEITALERAGAILGALAKAVAAGEVDGLNADATNLVGAFKDVLARL